MDKFIEHGISAAIGFAVGIFFDPIKSAVQRFFDGPKIEIEIHYWRFLQNHHPYSYVLDCNIVNNGRTKDHLREIILIVNPDQIETMYYGSNRFVAGSDFDRIEIPAHETKHFVTDSLCMREPYDNLEMKDRIYDNFKKVEIIFNFAINKQIRISVDGNILGDSIIIK